MTAFFQFVHSFKLNCLSENHINLIVPVRAQHALAPRLPRNDPLEIEAGLCQYIQHFIMEPERVNTGCAEEAVIAIPSEQEKWTHDCSAQYHVKQG